MADSNSIPRGLVLRRRTWHVHRSFRGAMVRVSTGCADLEAAKGVLRDMEKRYASRSLSAWWASEIAKARRREPSWLTRARGRAVGRARDGKSCSLTMDDVIGLAEASGGRCSVSGMEFSEAVIGSRRPFIPSLDRVDSARGYSAGNCRFVCAIVNYAMSDYGEAAFWIMVQQAVAHDLLRKAAETLHKTYPQNVVSL